MEENKSIDNQVAASGNLKELSEQDIQNLYNTGKWGKFLTIVGFVGLGLMVLGGIIMMFAGGAMFGSMGTGLGSAFGGIFFGIIYLGMAILYFFPTYFLFNFSTKVIKAVEQQAREILSESFRYLYKLYKLIGIFVIVVLSLYALGIVIAIFAGIISAF